ncbi:MAG: hypothetical protein LBK42_13805 [Propionibacteriaceae bacterium]|jgi:hypothetical protein|nr:hypothetical protein [Propionibacteriaceae bacterium]
MALTTAGSRLTLAHKRSQAALGLLAAASFREAEQLLDPRRLDATRDNWLTRLILVLAVAWQKALADTAAYLADYDQAEAPAARRLHPARTIPPLVVALPLFDPAAATAALAWAVPTIKTLTAAGLTADRARRLVLDALAARAPKQAMTPGRETVRETAARTGLRWRVVTDGNPCVWCAMLATKGPVYRSEQTAVRNLNGLPANVKYHDHCGCSAEIFYGDHDDWLATRTPQEEAWHDAYRDAYEAGHHKGRDLSQAMRDLDTAGLFADGEAARQKAKTARQRTTP